MTDAGDAGRTGGTGTKGTPEDQREGPASPTNIANPDPSPELTRQTTAPAEVAPGGPRSTSRVGRALRGLVVPALAVFTALLIGGLVIALSDRNALSLWGTDPAAALGASLSAVGRAYGALFSGSILDPTQVSRAIQTGSAADIRAVFEPLSETLLATTPLIFTGLAVALGFRSGLFNIGAEGQLYLGAIFATFAGFALIGLPFFIHLPITVAMGFLGGALWGFIPGFLKARTGAHEVIVTIMLNYIAYQILAFILKTSTFQRPGRNDPISKELLPTSWLPRLVGGTELRVHWGIVLALIAAVAVSWLLFRSTKGFEFRAVGLNPLAARYAGIGIGRTLVLTMMVSGGLAGLAGSSEIMGVSHTLFFGFSPGYGFDAIALALLGGSRPLGVVGAALLFGALRAGATPMQSATGIPIDLVVVIQALVIMFVAAPALVRGIYRIRSERVTGTEVFAKGWG